jgi:GST-like protein
MIALYTWKTPNGKKPAIMLEELGVSYHIHPVDIGKDEQFSKEFLRISPNNKIPGMIDNDPNTGMPVVLFESGAILTYLAEKYEKFLPTNGASRYKTMEWLYWQVGGLGPMLGQLGYYAVRAPEKLPQPIDRFTKEADRLLGVLDKHLQENEYLAGGLYTIADIATYPWVEAATTFLSAPLQESLSTKNSLKRWIGLISERPAVKKGMAILT